ncbi:MAG: hypothetical protein EU536_03060 [Promethearchaeota archaeon]|nr:MAG: hypothetical protein EU536_03060 [Candidatus Lokiarchaeota archaeon]
MLEKKDTPEGYPFGVYFCTYCQTVIMWYPDIKKHPELNLYPRTIQCATCQKEIPVKERLRIIDIWSDLVPSFLKVIESYPFMTAIICDEEHVHFVWRKSQ